MNLPDHLRYSSDHEWLKAEGARARIGITDYAQDKLGDVVYVDLPEKGFETKRDTMFGSVESVKAVSELFAPVTGTVLEVNEKLSDAPETVNSDPYGDAWMIKIQIKDLKELDQLMNAGDYKKYVADLNE